MYHALSSETWFSFLAYKSLVVNSEKGRDLELPQKRSRPGGGISKG